MANMDIHHHYIRYISYISSDAKKTYENYRFALRKYSIEKCSTMLKTTNKRMLKW